MNDVDHSLCGQTGIILTEAALTRLYDFPIRRVELPREEGTFNTLVPMFS